MLKVVDLDGNEVWINTRNVTRVFTLNGNTSIELAGSDRTTQVPNTMAEVARMINQPATVKLT